MRIELNADLSKYTTFKMGGIAEKLYFPENIDDLISLSAKLEKLLIISGGSNLLINNKKEFKDVICLREFDKTIEVHEDGVCRAGASVRLQKLIRTINIKGFGGIEYLYSVPGCVGGAIVMNAGRGEAYHKSISDYIISVTVLDHGEIKDLSKEDCLFSYRNSAFKNSDVIVLNVLFKFEQVSKETLDHRREERIKFCQDNQDNTAPNFGTVFYSADSRIMSIVRNSFLRTCGNIGYSKKTNNWMLNNNGDFADALRLIKRVQILHKILLRKCKLEVIVWE